MDGHIKHSKTKKSSKKREKTHVPKSFIQKIKRLGLKEEDAEVLYETKIDWTAVYSDNKIYWEIPKEASKNVISLLK